MKKFDVLIIGGGTAGITVAARLKSKRLFSNIGIIEPSDTHFYQPLWTLVGAGQVRKISTTKGIDGLVPNGVKWIKEKAKSLNPKDNIVQTDQGQYEYQYLVVATGIIPDWTFVEGLEEAIGQNQVCSVYTYETSDYTFESLKKAKEGNLIFTMPQGLLKCGGAPQKIMWLSEDYLQNLGTRKNFNIHFFKEGNHIFGVEKYKKLLDKLVEEREIQTHYFEKLVKVEGEKRLAFFENTDSGEIREISFELLHVVPKFKTHDFVSNSDLANEKGEIEVDPRTLQSPRHKNVFSLGDCSSCPTGKTGAAIRKQAPILIENLIDFHQGKKMNHFYDGYTACPVLTRHNKVMLAEFDYDGKPSESFPFNQAQESYLMYIFKRYLLPFLYWNFMLKGRM